MSKKYFFGNFEHGGFIPIVVTPILNPTPKIFIQPVPYLKLYYKEVNDVDDKRHRLRWKLLKEESL